MSTWSQPLGEKSIRLADGGEESLTKIREVYLDKGAWPVEPIWRQKPWPPRALAQRGT